MTHILFYCVVVIGTIAALYIEFQDQTVNASRAPGHDNYYQIILDQVSDIHNDNTPKLIDAPLISQLPELPRGCEVTSLAMLLNQAGVKVDKMTLAKEIKKDPAPWQVINGQVHFGNPNVGFVGSINTYNKPGLGVYHGPIAKLANHYMPGRIIDMTGMPFDAIMNQLDQGHPVWVIVSSTFKEVPDSEWMTWETAEGLVHVTKREHAVLLTGYDDDHVYFNDPLSDEKNVVAAKQDFINAWKQFGSQAISNK